MFRRLSQLVQAHAGFLDVQSDTNTEYILTGPMMPRWKKELWFGGESADEARLWRRLGRASAGRVSLKPRPVLQTERSYKPVSGGERVAEMAVPPRESRARL